MMMVHFSLFPCASHNLTHTRPFLCPLGLISLNLAVPAYFGSLNGSLKVKDSEKFILFEGTS